MNFTIKTAALQNISTSCMVLGVYQNKTLPEITAEIDKLTRKKLSKIIDAGDINGALGQSLLIHDIDGIRAKRILLIGLGKKSDLNLKNYVQAVNGTAQALKKHAITDALDTLVNLPTRDMGADKRGQLLAQIIEDSLYQYSHTKSDKGKKPALKKVDVFLADKSQR